jgi:alpha-L-rhamnosidase
MPVPAMNSYNHYAFGSVVAWVYESVIGIDTSRSQTGSHEIVIHPHVDAHLTHAQGTYESVYGPIETEWASTPERTLSMRVSIPANMTARVVLPDGLRLSTADAQTSRTNTAFGR